MTNIVSNYKDYYDYMAMYGIEKDLTYHRKERILDCGEIPKIIDRENADLINNLKDVLAFLVYLGGYDGYSAKFCLEAYLLESELAGYGARINSWAMNIKNILNNKNRPMRHEADCPYICRLKLDLFMICGKFYVVCEYVLSESPSRDKIIKSRLIGNDELMEGGFLKEIMKFYKGYSSYAERNMLESYGYIKDKDYSEVNKFFNSPVIKIKYDSHGTCCGSSYVSLVQFVMNPVLFPYQKYLPDSQTIWTELNTWLSNLKNETYKKEEIMPDVIKLEKKGFDRKTSFRKEKSSKKPRSR